jgi:drug/metabolite transporter (DMT)-like permease
MFRGSDMKPWIIYTIIAMIFYTIGEYYSKIYANTGRNLVLFFALLAYMFTTCFWFPSLKNNNQLIIMTVIWDIAYILVGFVLGFFVFHEVLSVRQWIGVGLSIISISLLVS